MRDFTNALLRIGAFVIAIGTVFVIWAFDPNLLKMSSLPDVGKYYGIYFSIVIACAIPLGIILGLFERTLDELFGGF
jgi:hypothetical protein